MYESRVTPEKRLLGAVLCRAILDYCGTSEVCKKDRQQIHRQAKKWIFDDHYRVDLTFTWICSELDLDPSALRRNIRELEAYARQGNSLQLSQKLVHQLSFIIYNPTQDVFDLPPGLRKYT